MNRDDRIFLIISVVAVILLSFTSLSLYVAKAMETDKRLSIQKRLDAISLEKTALETRVKELESSQSISDSNARAQEEKIAALTKDLETAKTANGASYASIQERESEIRRLKARIEELSQDKQKAMQDLEAMNERALNMKFQLENLLKTKEEMEKKAKEIANSEGVSLGTVVIRQNRN